MKIKTILVGSSCVLIASAFVIASLVFAANRRTEAIAQQGSAAEQLITDVFELHIFAQDYIAYPDERPKEQWYAQYDRVNDLLTSDELARAVSPATMGDLRQEMNRMKSDFDQLVRRNGRADEDVATQELSGDFLVHTRRMITLADTFAQQMFELRSQTRAATDRLVITLLAVLALLTNVLLYVCYRRIIGSIYRLQKGTRQVGKGDLAFRSHNTDTDEIGELSRAFDDMTERLQQSHAQLEQRVAERTAQLQAVSSKNETLLQSIGDGVVAIDTNWNIVLWNDAASTLTGWTKKEVLGKPFRKHIRLLREHDRTENILFISDAMLSGRVRMMENHTVLIRKDGSEMPVGDSAAPIINPHTKEVEGVIIVFRDTSQDRDAQLIRSSFAYASHQLRTPVTVALWNIELAQQEAKGLPVAEKIDIAHNSMKSMQKLVNELMEVSEIDQAIVIPKFASVRWSALFKELKAQVSAKAERAQVEIIFAGATGLKPIKTDPKLLRKALYEIIDNAVAYSRPKTKVSVTVSLQQKNVLVEIVDHGIGVPAEQQGLVFTKFFRGHNIPIGSVGVGLGLYISLEYVKLLKGKMWFTSDEDKGTTFYVSLPA